MDTDTLVALSCITSAISIFSPYHACVAVCVVIVVVDVDVVIVVVNIILLKATIEFLWWGGGWALHSHFRVQPNCSVEVLLLLGL